MIGREAHELPATSESDWPKGAVTRGLRTPTRARPFESTPFALRSALVVDPDEAQRRALADCLIRHDFTVHEATNAEAALRLAVARRPWLIITEAELADASGIEFCELIRSHSLLCRTPVVFLSESDDCDSRHQALKAGADDYLVKPAPSRELLVRLELVLKRFAGEESASAEPGGGLRGAIELMGAPAVLQICNLNQLTGVLARAPRQPVAADRLPARPDRLRDRARPARRPTSSTTSSPGRRASSSSTAAPSSPRARRCATTSTRCCSKAAAASTSAAAERRSSLPALRPREYHSLPAARRALDARRPQATEGAETRMPTKVMIVGLGPIGAAVARQLAARSNFKIVAAVDIDPAKVGTRPGRAAGPRSQERGEGGGRRAPAVRKAKPQVAVLCTSSALKSLWPQIAALLPLRIPIVSTTEELAYPWFSNRPLARKIDAAARKAKVALVGTGVNPGFAMDALPITLTAICERVDSIRVDRIQDARIRRLPFQQKIGSGLTPEQFAEKVKALTVRHVGLTESVAMIADALGWKLDRITDEIQPKIAQAPVESQFLKVPAGRVCGIVQDGAGYVARRAAHRAAHGGVPGRARDLRQRRRSRARRGCTSRRSAATTATWPRPRSPSTRSRSCSRPHPGCTRCAAWRCRPSPAESSGRGMRRRAFLRRTGAGALLAAARRRCWRRPRATRPRAEAGPARGDSRRATASGLVAPASANFQSVDIEIAQDVARAFSLEPRLGAHVRDRHGYLAGRDEDRAADVNAFFADASVSARVRDPGRLGLRARAPAPRLGRSIRKNPKVVTGYSDITALHCGLHARSRPRRRSTRPTLLSDWPAFSVEHFRRVVFEGERGHDGEPAGRGGPAGAAREPHAHDHAGHRARPAAGRQPDRAHGAHGLALPAGLRRRDPVPRGRARGHLPRRPHADASSRSAASSASCAASCSARATSASPARATARSRSRRCSTSTCGRSACRRTRAP